MRHNQRGGQEGTMKKLAIQTSVLAVAALVGMSTIAAATGDEPTSSAVTANSSIRLAQYYGGSPRSYCHYEWQVRCHYDDYYRKICSKVRVKVCD
jgi:hypothetical protein